MNAIEKSHRQRLHFLRRAHQPPATRPLILALKVQATPASDYKWHRGSTGGVVEIFFSPSELCQSMQQSRGSLIFQEGNSSRLVIISAQNVLLTPEGLYHAETPAQRYSLVLGWNFPTNCFSNVFKI